MIERLFKDRRLESLQRAGLVLLDLNAKRIGLLYEKAIYLLAPASAAEGLPTHKCGLLAFDMLQLLQVSSIYWCVPRSACSCNQPLQTWHMG
jgi:hypothetical protein